jgi:hypothetical protein
MMDGNLEESPFTFSKKSGIAMRQRNYHRRMKGLSTYSKKDSSSTMNVTSGIEFSVDGVTSHIRDPAGFESFRLFLMSQRREQNIDFWKAVEEIQPSTVSFEKMHKIGALADRFIKDDAVKEITVLNASEKERFFISLSDPEESYEILKEFQRKVCVSMRDLLCYYLDTPYYKSYLINRGGMPWEQDEEDRREYVERQNETRARLREESATISRELEEYQNKFLNILDSSDDDAPPALMNVEAEGESSSWENAKCDSDSDTWDNVTLDAGESGNDAREDGGDI